MGNNTLNDIFVGFIEIRWSKVNIFVELFKFRKNKKIQSWKSNLIATNSSFSDKIPIKNYLSN